MADYTFEILPTTHVRPINRIATVLDDPTFVESGDRRRENKRRARQAAKRRARTQAESFERRVRQTINGAIPVTIVAAGLVVMRTFYPELIDERTMQFLFGEWWPAKIAVAAVVVGSWTMG